MTIAILHYRIVGWWLRTWIKWNMCEAAMVMKYLHWRVARRNTMFEDLQALYDSMDERLRGERTTPSESP